MTVPFLMTAEGAAEPLAVADPVAEPLGDVAVAVVVVVVTEPVAELDGCPGVVAVGV